MPRGTALVGLVLTAWMAASCAASMQAKSPDMLPQNPEESSRRTFLQAVDSALASRDPIQLSKVADLDRWRTARRPDLDRLTLWIPPAPITRTRDLTPSEVLYEDGEGRSWRLRLSHDEARHVWKVILPDRPCPPKGPPRVRPDSATGADAPAARSPEVWTVLECWPLPR